MRTTIDRGGRVVIPKSMRDELGLTPGQEVDLAFDGYTIRIERVAPEDPHLVEERGLLVISPEDRTPITDDDVELCVTRSSAEATAVADTSVAVPAMLETHTAHVPCRDAVRRHRAALAGHAVFETYSVLTRLPVPVRLTPATAVRLLDHNFPSRVWLSGRDLTELLGTMAAAGIAAGAVYDAMVGAAALAAGQPLLTRDQRALATYARMGVPAIVVRDS